MEEGWTEQERRMLQVLREWGGADQHKKIIELQDGAWEITQTGILESRIDHRKYQSSAQGVGETFNEAWDNMSPTWA